MKLIQFPKKESKSQTKPMQGSICFNWNDVELVECSENGKGILHFRSGRTYTSGSSYEDMRKNYMKHQRN